MPENPFDLTGKVTLVTGANSGLGLGWAMESCALAATSSSGVAALTRTRPPPSRCGSTGRACSRSRSTCRTSSRSCGRCGRRSTQLGRLDGAIANAGFGTHPPSFLDLTSDEWHSLLNTNLHGAYYTLRETVRHMMGRHEAGDPGGSIVVCGSLSVTDGVPRIAHYAAAKGGMASVTKSLAVEYGRYGIRVNMVLPGRIMTNLGGTTPEQKAAAEARAKVIPIPRMGTPEDCAGIVVYLLSDAASYHTGDLITVDGGLAVTLP